jgi:hypothetical protein
MAVVAAPGRAQPRTNRATNPVASEDVFILSETRASSKTLTLCTWGPMSVSRHQTQKEYGTQAFSFWAVPLAIVATSKRVYRAGLICV